MQAKRLLYFNQARSALRIPLGWTAPYSALCFSASLSALRYSALAERQHLDEPS